MVVLLLCLALATIANAACPSYAGTRVSSLPSTTTSMNVPAGSVYVYDLATSYNFTTINVYGTLVFEDTKDLMLIANMILVQSGGKLVAGSCDCPFTNKLVLEFYGTTASPMDAVFGTKGVRLTRCSHLTVLQIGVNGGGTLDLYGTVFGPSWTQLAATANVGATTITLSETVNWQVGDQLVIATTDYWESQNEEV
jgi:hypothetical protein